MKSGHFATLEVDWASPLLLVAGTAVVLTIAQRYFSSILMKYGFGMSKDEMEVDEDLPHFYNITTMSQRNQMVTMYNNMKKNFGFEYTDPDTIDALKSADYPERTITGTPWYNVMSNPQYVNDFCFVPSYVSEREKIINDGYPDAHGDKDEIKYKCE